ncbi:hypothetical protein IU474_16745 [Nocardia otitidiscaviarum]|uniref:hypothetical protein n=1 Tax=Nocardia otitidiscaviarum TaxID=1823 RepID=UPI001895C22A|nr:hypothetical protein [Nocardia otitidiscaviarum]MBF6238699.1 hypothetical protein [Nocardia otitidiscaviarum]
MDPHAGIPRSRIYIKSVSPLMVVRSAFDAMAADPVGLPPECVIALGGPVASWGRLREALCEPGLSLTAVDTVWAWLVRRARQGDAGHVAALTCVGMALPMLTNISRRVTRSAFCVPYDAEAQILDAFLAAIGRVDLSRPGVWPRLRWAAFVGGRAWVRGEVAAAIPTMGLTNAGEDFARPVATAKQGHPELLLAQAVAEGVLDADAAGLIATTRLQKHTLTAMAAESGLPYKRLEKRRSRAEARLAAWLRQRMAEPRGENTSVVEQHALDAVARTRTGVAQIRSRSVSQMGVPVATTRRARTTRLPAFGTPAEVNRRCA